MGDEIMIKTIIFIIVLSGVLSGLLRFLKERDCNRIVENLGCHFFRFLLGGVLGAFVALTVVVEFSELDLSGILSDNSLEVTLAFLLTASISIVGGYIGTSMLDKLGSIALSRLESINEKANVAIKSAEKARFENEAQNLVEAAKELAHDLRSRDESYCDLWKEVIDITTASIQRAENDRAFIIRASARSKLGDFRHALQDLARAEVLVRARSGDIEEIEDPYAYTQALIYWNRACYLSLSKDKAKEVVECLERSIKFYRAFEKDLHSEEDLDWVRSHEMSDIKTAFERLTVSKKTT